MAGAQSRDLGLTLYNRKSKVPRHHPDPRYPELGPGSCITIALNFFGGGRIHTSTECVANMHTRPKFYIRELVPGQVWHRSGEALREQDPRPYFL